MIIQIIDTSHRDSDCNRHNAGGVSDCNMVGE